MKAHHDRNQTGDLTLHREIVGGVMDLLVDGPGLVLRSAPGNQPTRGGLELELLP
jgi:hypothetical protein